MRGRFRRARPAVKREPTVRAFGQRAATLRRVMRAGAELQPVSHSGRCAIVGRPNVGKSTLLNALLGQKLSIATPKPQTTRTCILGVYAQKEPPLQIAFVDTPGLHAPANALGRALLEEAKAGLLDGRGRAAGHAGRGRGPRRATCSASTSASCSTSLRGDARPVVLAINKVDRLKHKALLLPMLRAVQRRRSRSRRSCRSPRATASACRRWSREIGDAPAARPALRRGLLTDKSERFFAAELVREAVIRHTRQELPYAVAVVIDEFSEEGALTRIAATIVVDKESQKPIVIGKGGQRLKEIGTEARLELETLLERKVFLKLWVKVAPGWTERPEQVRELLGSDAAPVDFGE